MLRLLRWQGPALHGAVIDLVDPETGEILGSGQADVRLYVAPGANDVLWSRSIDDLGEAAFQVWRVVPRQSNVATR